MTVSEQQIQDFFYGTCIENESVKILEKGKAEMLVKSMADVDNALKYNKQVLGNQSITVTQT